MDLHLSHVARGTRVHRLKQELARILHARPFSSTSGNVVNFEINFIPQRREGTWRSATLTLPSVQLALDFLDLYGGPAPSRSLVLGNIRVQFERSRRPRPRAEVLERVQRQPYEDPVIAEAREVGEEQAAKVQSLIVQITTIQFGWECRDQVYSIEWEKPCPNGRLHYDADRREFRVTKPDLEEHRIIVIHLNQIAWVSASVHRPSARPVIFFSLSHPPSFESESSMSQLDAALGPSKNIPTRQRWSYFTDDHEPLAPYTSLAIRLECASFADINLLRDIARSAHVSSLLDISYPIERRNLFSDGWRDQYKMWVATLPWMIRFRVEALLRSWLVDMKEVLTLRDPIDRVLRRHKGDYTSALLQDFAAVAKSLYWYGHDDTHPTTTNAAQNHATYTANTVLELFHQVRNRFVYKPPQVSLASGDITAPFHCLHVVVTPTTMILEGPFPEQSNRVMRTYYNNQDSFLRVSFQDENRLLLRFDRDVDGRSFVDRRVKRMLYDGIDIAGSHFDFLAYSQSALKEHAVWFVKPFRHVNPSGRTEIVDAASIIRSLGNFRNLAFDPKLIFCPARYAARISQAFTATDASISMEVGQIMQGRDMKDPSGVYDFTDGVGSMSPSLAKEIWRALREQRRRGRKDRPYPRAVQVRFQGSKGMLSVDYLLSGLAILLRPSMIKFEAPQTMEIEIARAFDRPGMYYLNRPLIMLLEGLGVEYEVFKGLQDDAVQDAQGAIKSLDKSARLLEMHGLGVAYRLTSTMIGLHKLGLGPLRDDVFWKQAMAFAVNHVLRELKHRARIPVPGRDSWTVVGVADVHGYLKEGEIFVCIDSPNDSGVIYLEGPTLVSRSPTIHPGDVQVVRAIGNPPPDSPFARESLRNTIVFSIKGSRPLPSYLGGGDLDGDVYNVTTRRGLRPKTLFPPANYEPAQKKLVDHESTMRDVADFIAEFINSDTLGIIASLWLKIADKDGITDPDCLKLAALHSDAVDYPKTGQPVPLIHIPKPHGRLKPDWSAPETITSASSAAYFYESEKAIGRLFRSINLPAVRIVERAARFQRRHMPNVNHEEQVVDVLRHFYADNQDPEEDDVLETVRDRVSEFIVPEDYDDDTIVGTWETYNSYASQLRAVCADHTLSNTRAAMLTEEEAMVGTIVAKCSQPRMRTDLMSRMRESTATLASSVRGEISGDDDVLADESLRRAWIAYRLGRLEGNIFGARSFTWIALGCVFDAIKEIEDEERTASRRG